MTLSDYLKEVRLSQMEFARDLGVTQGAVSFWMHNGRITIERAIQIEKATDGKVTCEELCPAIDWAYLRGTTSAPTDPVQALSDASFERHLSEVAAQQKEAA